MSNDEIIAISRLADGRYRAERGSDWIEWYPSVKPGTAVHRGESSSEFRQGLRNLDLGIACTACGYLEFEHNIDGEERAPCDEFKG